MPMQRQLFGAARFAVRSAMQRRLASSSPQAGENAFIRERQAVKEHAAATTGEISEPLGLELVYVLNTSES